MRWCSEGQRELYLSAIARTMEGSFGEDREVRRSFSPNIEILIKLPKMDNEQLNDFRAIPSFMSEPPQPPSA